MNAAVSFSLAMRGAVVALRRDELPAPFLSTTAQGFLAASRAHPLQESVGALPLAVGDVAQVLLHRAPLYGVAVVEIKEKSLVSLARRLL